MTPLALALPRSVAAQQADRPAEQPTSAAEAAAEPGYLGLVAEDPPVPAEGLRVREVIPGGPSDRAGLRPGDVLIEIDGRPLHQMDDLKAMIEGSRPGDVLRVRVGRGRAQRSLDVELGSRPPPGERRFDDFGRITEPPGTPPHAAGGGQTLLGVVTVPLPESAWRRLRIPTQYGALVVQVVPGSPAERAGIAIDAVIVGVDGRAVSHPDDLRRLVQTAGPGREVAIDFYDRGQSMTRRVILGGGGDDSPPGRAEGSPSPLETPGPVDEAQRGADEETLRRIDRLERRLDQLLERMERIEAALERAAPGGNPQAEPARESP